MKFSLQGRPIINLMINQLAEFDDRSAATYLHIGDCFQDNFYEVTRYQWWGMEIVFTS